MNTPSLWNDYWVNWITTAMDAPNTPPQRLNGGRDYIVYDGTWLGLSRDVVLKPVYPSWLQLPEGL